MVPPSLKATALRSTASGHDWRLLIAATALIDLPGRLPQPAIWTEVREAQVARTNAIDASVRLSQPPTLSEMSDDAQPTARAGHDPARCLP